MQYKDSGDIPLECTPKLILKFNYFCFIILNCVFWITKLLAIGMCFPYKLRMKFVAHICDKTCSPSCRCL